MSINEKLLQISAKYKELRSADSPLVKRMIIQELRKASTEAEALMQLEECPENSRRRRQLSDILNKCNQLEKELTAQMAEEIGQGGRGGRAQLSRGDYRGPSVGMSAEQVSRMAVRSVVMREIRSSQLRVRPEEVEEIAQRMERNLEVMQEIEEMVREQGGNLERIDEYLEIAYDNAEHANQELTEAKELQTHSRRMKFRLAVSGFFGALGYKILGLPGMIMGFLFGAKSA